MPFPARFVFEPLRIIVFLTRRQVCRVPIVLKPSALHMGVWFLPKCAVTHRCLVTIPIGIYGPGRVNLDILRGLKVFALLLRDYRVSSSLPWVFLAFADVFPRIVPFECHGLLFPARPQLANSSVLPLGGAVTILRLPLPP